MFIIFELLGPSKVETLTKMVDFLDVLKQGRLVKHPRKEVFAAFSVIRTTVAIGLHLHYGFMLRSSYAYAIPLFLGRILIRYAYGCAVAAAARKGRRNKVVCVGRTRDDAHRIRPHPASDARFVAVHVMCRSAISPHETKEARPMASGAS